MHSLAAKIAGALSVGLLVVVAGCGGGGANTNSVSSAARKGGVQVQIKWPARTRLVPQAADYVNFTVYSDAGLSQQVNSFTGQRPSTSVSTTSWAVSPTAYAAGTYYIQASAYANSDAVHALASGVTSVVVTAGNTSNFNITLASAVAQFKLSGAVTGVVALGGSVTGTPNLVVAGGGWGQPQTVIVEPEDATGDALVLLSSTSNLALTASSNLTVGSSGTINGAKTQFSVPVTPTGTNASSYLQVTYTDGDASSSSGLTNATAQMPITVTAPTVNVSVTIPGTLATVPAVTNTTANPLVAVSQASLSDSGGANYSPSSWSISGGAVTLTYIAVTDKNLTFSSNATVRIKDQASTWHTFMTASTSSVQTLGSATPTVTLSSGNVGNLSIGTTNLGSFNSGTWPSTWGVVATVGGTQASFSPTLFASGTPTLTGTVLTGTWPNITAATLSSSTSSVNGTVSIPISFNNGPSSTATGAVTATILPLTGSGSGSIG